jgi:hypothetical protein
MKFKFLYFSFYFWLLITPYIAHSQEDSPTAEELENYDPNRVYNIQQLQSDFIILRWVLEKAHPGLYWYTPKIAFDQKFDSTYALLNKPMTEGEFYKFLAPLIAQIHCGHTILDPSYFYQDLGKRFPLDLKFTDNQTFIRYNYSDNDNIVVGSQLLKINGQDIQEIIQQIMPALAADALHNQGKWDALETDFQNYYDLMIAKPDSFVLDCIDYQTQKPVQWLVKASDDGFLKGYDKRYYQELESEKSLNFKILDSLQTGILTINSFLPVDIKFHKQKFSKYIKNVFAEISRRNINHLVIDLRKNNGGEMLYANELFSYMALKPYKFLDKVQVTSNKKLTQLSFTELSKVTIHNPRKVMFTDSGYVVKSGYYKFLEVQKPKKSVFAGDLYVLIGKRTFSAANIFSSLVYAYKRGKFVGEETGGGSAGLNGGDFVNIALPNTGLLIEVPLERWMKYISDPHLKNRGIIPQYPVQNTIEDELKGFDRVMDYTLQVIKEGK